MDEFEIAIRRAIIARLNKMAKDELGEHVQKMFNLGRWSGILNRIDPDSPHCVLDDRKARIWSDNAILYLKNYKDGLLATHTTPSSDESTLRAKLTRAR